MLNNQTIECFLFKICIFSAYLRYVQLFSNSITVQLIFIQRRYMRATLLVDIIYSSHSDVITTACYISLDDKYHCRPHISLLLQTYEETVNESLWKLGFHDIIMDMIYVLMLSISNYSEILNCVYFPSYLYRHIT